MTFVPGNAASFRNWPTRSSYIYLYTFILYIFNIWGNSSYDQQQSKSVFSTPFPERMMIIWWSNDYTYNTMWCVVMRCDKLGVLLGDIVSIKWQCQKITQKIKFVIVKLLLRNVCLKIPFGTHIEYIASITSERSSLTMVFFINM